MSQVLTPTLFLHGIDTAAIQRRYWEGAYDDYVPQRVAGLNLPSGSCLDIDYGTSQEDGLYKMSDRDGHELFIATSNQKDFDTSTKKKREPVGGNCWHCRQPFEGRGLPLPRAYRKDFYVRQEDGKDIHEEVDIVWGTVKCCCFGCLIKLGRQQTKVPIYKQDPSYQDCEQVIFLMFRRMHPDGELVACPDAELLDANGGPLSAKEFYKCKYEWVPVPGLILAEAKSQYARYDIDQSDDEEVPRAKRSGKKTRITESD